MTDIEIISKLSNLLDFQLVDHSEIGWSNSWDMGYILKDNKVVSLKFEEVGFLFLKFNEVGKLIDYVCQFQSLQELSLSGLFVDESLTKLADLNQLHTLSVNVYDIDLLPIPQLANLKKLDLTVLSSICEDEIEINSLACLANLEELKIGFDDYSFFISPLSKLPKLQRLEINFSMVNDLKSFIEFSRLEELCINYSSEDKPNEYFEKYLSKYLPNLHIARGEICSDIVFNCYNGFNSENQSAEIESIQMEIEAEECPF